MCERSYFLNTIATPFIRPPLPAAHTSSSLCMTNTGPDLPSFYWKFQFINLTLIISNRIFYKEKASHNVKIDLTNQKSAVFRVVISPSHCICSKHCALLIGQVNINIMACFLLIWYIQIYRVRRDVSHQIKYLTSLYLTKLNIWPTCTSPTCVSIQKESHQIFLSSYDLSIKRKKTLVEEELKKYAYCCIWFLY